MGDCGQCRELADSGPDGRATAAGEISERLTDEVLVRACASGDHPRRASGRLDSLRSRPAVAGRHRDHEPRIDSIVEADREDVDAGRGTRRALPRRATEPKIEDIHPIAARGANT